MTIIVNVLIVLTILYILIQIFYLLMLLITGEETFETPEEYPAISILVAARNEEHNILHCMESLHALDYPKDKTEIIIGNDLSTDSTKEIIEEYIKDKPHFRCVSLTGDEFPNTKGKARVLAVLAALAKGKVLLITDADIFVNPHWAKGMVNALLSTKSGMVAGVTNIKAHNFFTRFQQVDWLYFMGIFYTFSTIKRPISAVGNNMALLREAYEATGGYETIPFSITEDYALFKAVRAKGYTSRQLMNSDTLLYSKPMDTMMGLLKQRKRWLVGGFDLPLYYKLMLFIFGTWYIAIPVLCFTGHWMLALSLLILKDFIQLFQILLINQKLKLKVEHPVAVFLYDVYLFVVIPLTVLYFFIPVKTVWKGRKY